MKKSAKYIRLALYPVAMLMGGLIYAMIVTYDPGMLNWTEYTVVVAMMALIALVLLAHLPAFATVVALRKAMGKNATALGPYPEVPLPVLLLLTWLLGGFIVNDLIAAGLIGLTVAAALAVCYAAVRVVTHASAGINASVDFVPGFSTAPLSRIGIRAIYQLRLIVPALSLAGLIAMGLTGRAPLFVAVVAVVVLALAGMAAATLWLIMRGQADTARAQAPGIIAAALRDQKPTFALHYSSLAKSAHKEPMKLADRLRAEDKSAITITREMGARSVMAQSIPNVWIAPSIAALDGFALPTLQAMFYINDGIKNGHVVRFNQYAHVLVTTGGLSKLSQLPSNLQMYDAIIAPSRTVADTWCSGALAARVFTVGPAPKQPAYNPVSRFPTGGPALALHIGTATVADDAQFALMQRSLPDLLKTVAAADNMSLGVSFDAPSADPQNGRLGHLYGIAQQAVDDYVRDHPKLEKGKPGVPAGGRITVKTGAALAAANKADFVIVTPVSHLDALRQTGKPLLWWGVGKTPAGLYPTGPDIAEALPASVAAALQGDPLAHARADLVLPDPGNFTSFTSLVAHVRANKYGSGMKPWS